MTPEVIGDRYHVERAIGHGGMGTVWLCADSLLGRDVAVKQVGLLPGESATDSARALREARSSAHLNHRNVVSVFDIVEDSGAIWMVMEYVPSRTLAQLVRDDGPLSPLEVADLGAQVADGLAAAHAAGIIHRDVKPDNVLVTEDGTAKITDFGIAHRQSDQPLTQSGLVTGTPAYFAPELAEGGDPSPAADVWALGATLYTAVEGEPPFPRKSNPVAMLRTIATQPPARPRRAGFLEPALGRLLDRDPGSRWTMSDTAHALRRLSDRHADSTLVTGTAATRDTRAARGRGGLGAAAGAAGAAGAAEAAGAPEAARAGGGAGEVAGPTPATEPAVPPPSEAGDADAPPPERARRRFPVLPLVALVALLAAAGVGYLLLGGSPGTSPQAGPGHVEGSHSPSAGASAPHSPSPKPSPTSTPSLVKHTKAAQHSKAAAPSSSGSVAGFLRAYYQLAPRNQDAGWARLGPDEQQVGRASYDKFWRSLDHVQVHSVQPSGKSATVELTYYFDDGRVVDERQRIDLIGGDGGYRIDKDTVLSSRTVSG